VNAPYGAITGSVSLIGNSSTMTPLTSWTFCTEALPSHRAQLLRLLAVRAHPGALLARD